MDVKLYNGDCLIEMDKIPNKSIDFICTDLPYGTTNCSWDNVIPFEPMWEQINRVIKDNGAIALFGAEPFSSQLRCSNLENYKYDWIWEKEMGTGFLNAKKQPLRNFENILIFYKNRTNYNPQMKLGKPYISCNGKNSSVYMSNLKEGTKTINRGLRYPTSIIKFNRDMNKVHPTQKPVDLLQYLIKTYTNENDTVLDFTMGSGSCGVASVSTNRNFIGIELDKEYFNIAKKRINEANMSIFDI